MVEKKDVFSSKVKYNGIANFKDFYKFCYEWLKEETELDDLSETKYVEKVAGDSKEIELEWVGSNKFSDYFQFKAKINMRILALKNIEMQDQGKTIKTNTGNFEVKIKGTLLRDYEGKFEKSSTMRILRSFYDKYILQARIESLEEKVAKECNDFLEQAKAYLAIEGKQ